MNEGLMIYEKTTINQLVADALAEYQRKHNRPANTVHINLKQYDPAIEVEGVDIVGARNVLHNHAWVGVK